MTTKKKTVIAITTLSLLLLAVIAGLVIAIVAITQSAQSKVKVKYTATDVHVVLLANAYVGDTKIQFVNGESNELELSPTNNTGSLDQPNSDTDILLDRDNSEVVFEYIFVNKSESIDVEIILQELPEIQNNITFSYAYADAPVADFSTLSRVDDFENQLLPAYIGENPAKYIYIFAKVSDLLYDADLEGSFSWAMGRAETVAVNLGVGETVNNASTVGKALASTGVMPEPAVYPALNNTVFRGWATTPDATEEDVLTFPINLSDYSTASVETSSGEEVVTNTISAPSDFALYPVYIEGNIDDYLAYDSTKDCYYVISGYYQDDTTGRYAGTDPVVVIPDYYNDNTHGNKPVSYISDNCEGYGALCSSDIMEKIIVGANITDMGCWFAAYCPNLKTIEYAKNCKVVKITDIYMGAVMSMYVPKSVQSISSVGYGYTITDIVLEEGNPCFYLQDNCLISVATNTVVRAAGNCVVPKGVNIDSWDSFRYNDGITSVNLPNTIESIPEGCFSGCTNLATINIPSSVTSIGSYAFSSCSNLTNITIPESVTNIGNNVFSDCYKLVQVQNLSDESVSNLPNNPYMEVIGANDSFYTSIDIVNDKYVVYSTNELYGNLKILLGYVKNFKFDTADDIPIYITNIYQYCFCDGWYNNNGIKSITIPSSVTSIGNSAFRDCTGLTSVTIPSSVKTISSYAFSGCTGLTSATIEEGVTSIGDHAFSGCSGLTSITIPASVKEIGSYVFYGSGITSLTIEGDNTAWTKKSYNANSYSSATVNFSDPAQNATYFKSTSGYYNYYWKR